jgi:hypothetical protein
MCHVVPCQAILGTRHGKTALAPMLRKMARGSEYEHTSLFVDRCFGIPRILPSRSELSLSAIRVLDGGWGQKGTADHFREIPHSGKS